MIGTIANLKIIDKQKLICTLPYYQSLTKETLMAYENSPMFVDETPGIKNYCTCGESANKPYCDGSHSAEATGKTPKEFIVDESRRLALCDCGKTGKSPICDGTHSKG